MSVSVYRKKQSMEVTYDFEHAVPYGKAKLGTDYIYWKKMLSWNYVSFDEIVRIYRRVEAVDTKMCCGNVNFDVQKLILELKDGTSCEIVISEGVPREAEALYTVLREKRADILFGKA